MSNEIPSATAALAGLRAAWQASPSRADLEAIAAESTQEKRTVEGAETALRSVALALARSVFEGRSDLPLLKQALSFFEGRPIRRWEDVLWALDLAAVVPTTADGVVRTLVVSCRLGVKNEVAWLANLARWGDATDQLLPEIRNRLIVLLPHRQELGWVLFRQLVKSLPHLGAQRAEISDIRSAAEYIQWLLDCPLTMDIREETHSRASSANLTLIRAYRKYLESADSQPLAELWLAQKIPEHDAMLAASDDPPTRKARLLTTARELERLLTRIYAFDPDGEAEVFADARLWLEAAGLGPGSPGCMLVANVLERCEKGDRLAAARALGEARRSLIDMVDELPPEAALNTLYLDLELEKLGYILFGDVIHTALADIDPDNLGAVIAVLRSMVVSETTKGQGTPRLRWLGTEFEELSANPLDRMVQLLVLGQEINEEIAQISLSLWQHYSGIVRSLLQQCEVDNVEIRTNRFVDGLVRGTTLHHLGELTGKLHQAVLTELEDRAGENPEAIRARVDHSHRYFHTRAIAALGAQTETERTPMLIYRFQARVLAHRERRTSVLGGKGAKLCEMCQMGLPVPPGFIVSVGACERFMRIDALDPSVREEIDAALDWLQTVTARRIGGTPDPLLVSVRSGAPESMPGMLDTILNVGMTDETVDALAAGFGREPPALEIYLRFLTGYAKTVLSLPDLAPLAMEFGPTWAAVSRVKDEVRRFGAGPFWESEQDQFANAIEAVFRSWNNPHATLFRQTHHMPQAGCTAAVVQQMVFGNADERSCTGVVFTRNPVSGAPGLYGEYLPCAQGEVLVSGTRTPLPVLPDPSRPGRSLEENMPGIVARLREYGDLLETHYRDMQDIEFTVERGTLHILQTRAGQRTPEAAQRIARDLPLSPAAATDRPVAEPSPRTEHPSFRILARGLGASPGGVFGRVALSCAAAKRFAAEGGEVVLVRPATTPDDLDGMIAATGVLTKRGGGHIPRRQQRQLSRYAVRCRMQCTGIGRRGRETGDRGGGTAGGRRDFSGRRFR